MRDRLRDGRDAIARSLQSGSGAQSMPVAMAAAALALNSAGAAPSIEQLIPTSAKELIKSWSYDFALSTNPRFTRVNAHLLTASKRFKLALMEEEGVRYTVYRDVAGYPTVGVGHLVTPADGLRVGDTITPERAMAFLDTDLRTAERGAARLLKDLPVYQHEYDAVVDLVYNVGAGNVAPDESPRLNEAIAAGDYRTIAQELHYTTAGGQVANGLVNRSERRAAIFADGDYRDPRTSA